MKIITLLFSFYLLGLSCFPCGDTEECTEKYLTTISTPLNHDNHNQEAENCTPLCHCSCCAASVCVEVTAANKIPKKIFSSDKYPFYQISYFSQVSASIWQPPKFS